MHAENCFVTLTYNQNSIPQGNTLVLSDLQLFLKRLRKKIWSTSRQKIKFYACGEYGEKTSRPHYHLAIFGYDFPDKKIHSKNRAGDPIFTSQILSELWPDGHSTTAALTFESAAYIARYVMKKITGDRQQDHYMDVDSDGVITNRKPEFNTMSRRGGIGSSWLKKYNTDVYSGDFVVINGKKARPPRFYDGQYEIIDPSEYATIKARRVRNARQHADNNTPDRLKVRESVQAARFKQLKRELE